MHTNLMRPLPDISSNNYYASHRSQPKKSQSAFTLTQNGEKLAFKDALQKRKKQETVYKNEVINKKHEFTASLKRNNILTNQEERTTM